jgi:hypothetical protein
MTDHSAEKKLTVLKHLASGKTADVVATITRLDRYEVIDLASSHGYPDVDKMTKAVGLLTDRINRDRQSEIPTAQPTRPQPVAVAPLVAQRTPQSSGPLTPPDEIRALLNTAKDHPSRRIQAAADRAFDQLDRVRALLREDQEKHAEKRAEQARKAAARAEVERLERQLADAKAKLRGTAAATAQSSGPAASVIRDWARTAGIECPATGKVPRSVREAYDQAHHQAAS